jgi:hypothetical protein
MWAARRHSIKQIMSKKSTLLKLADWNASESGEGGSLSVQNGMKLHIHDQATWMEWKEDPVTKVPHCILQYLRGKEGDDMELRCPEETYITGESVIVEDIDKRGAHILITKQMQSELAFAVTSIDVVAFRQTDFILQGQSYEHTQYCCDLPDNLWQICCILLFHRSRQEIPEVSGIWLPTTLL